ncbi:MAG: Bifunctional protein hldE [Chlamydiota bacterium]
MILSLGSFRALLFGDFLLDSYTTGRVRRISPEAPVPILEVQTQESRPGGAGNVALNLRALGGSVTVFGRFGADEHGAKLTQVLELAGVDVRFLCQELDYPTPVKNRLIADSQQLLRVDTEKVVPLSAAVQTELLSRFQREIISADVLVISDYGKGCLTPTLIQQLLQSAQEANVPTIVDPKGTEFTKYRGVDLIKPNLTEAYAAARLPTTSSLDAVAETIFNDTKAKYLLITRSEAGMTLYDQALARRDFPVRNREVKDVTGAGDTVLAVMAFGLAHQIAVSHIVPWANIAAGLAIERLGCVQITKAEIASALSENG